MSTALLTSTSFVGMDIGITRTPQWQTRVQENVAGHETRVALRTLPRYTWEVNFNVLRNSTRYGGGGSSEFSAMMDFYNARSGGFDSFQWLDPEDNAGSLEVLTAVSAGVYQLSRNLDGLSFNDPIYAPSSVSQVWIAGSSASTAGITGPTFWGSASPGQITLSTATPSTATQLFANFSYYWPVRFDTDKLAFQRIMSNLWELKKVSFTSII